MAVFVSINHVIAFYELTNPSGWAIYLSIGVEIAALSALAGMVKYVNKKTYFPFIVVTLIQLIGNVFSSYLTIDINSNLYKTWTELISFFFTFEDPSSNKAFLALIAGVPIPILSLSFLDILVSFNTKQRIKNETEEIEKIDETTIINGKNEDEILQENDDNKKIVEKENVSKEKEEEVKNEAIRYPKIETSITPEELTEIDKKQAKIVEEALEKMGKEVPTRNNQKRIITPKNGRN